MNSGQLFFKKGLNYKMALINCPECSKQISDKATNCPNCGYPIQQIKANTITVESSIMQVESESLCGLDIAPYESDVELIIQHENYYISSVAISSDNKYIVSGGEDSSVKIWDLSSGKVKILKGHSASINAVAISNDNKYIISGGEDSSVKMWDLSSGNLLNTLEGHSAPVNSVAISHDNLYVVSGGGTCGAFAIAKDTSIKLWARGTGKLIKTFEGHSAPISSVAITHDKKYIVSGACGNSMSVNDINVKVWDLATGKLQKTLKGTHSYSISSVAISHDNRYIISGDQDNGEIISLWSGQTVKKTDPSIIKVWDLATGKLLGNLIKGNENNFHSKTNSLVISKDDKYIVSGHDDTTIKIWDLASGNLLNTLEGHSAPVNSVAISHDSKYIVSSGKSAQDFNEMEEKTMGEEAKNFRRLAFNTGKKDNTVKIWDLATGNLLVTLCIFKNEEWVVYTPDARFDASNNAKKYISFKIGDITHPAENFWGKYYTPGLLTKIISI